MDGHSPLPEPSEVAGDLAAIRRLGWVNPIPILRLRALFELVPSEERPERSDAEGVRDAIYSLLRDYVDSLEATERSQPPHPLGHSDAVAAHYLLRLDDALRDRRVVQVDDLIAWIVAVWRIPSGKQMEPGTFQTNHRNAVYARLAAGLLARASEQQIDARAEADETPPASADTSCLLAEVSRVSEAAHSAFRAQQYAEALPLARQAVALREQAYGPDDPWTMGDLHLLIYVLNEFKQYAEMREHCERLVSVRREQFGTSDPRTRDALRWLEIAIARQ